MDSCHIQFWMLIVSVISTILWAIYVYFTIKTFKEIKEQTSLQSKSFLVVKIDSTDKYDHNNININTMAMDMHIKWKSILKNNLAEALKDEYCFYLNLTNRGMSDIISWSIVVCIEISPGEYLRSTINSNKDRLRYVIDSSSTQQIGPGESITIPILPYGYYPKADITWNIEYKDIRGNTAQSTTSNNKHTLNNLIALNYNSSNN